MTGAPPSSASPPSQGFGARLAAQVAARSSQLVLGLDPDPARLWPRAIELAGGPTIATSDPQARAALAVAAHCSLAIEAVADHCVAIKLQLACFERLGPAGWAALGEVARRAREHDLLVIADGKRGDIDISAAAYAQAFFGTTATVYGPVDGLGADALTVNPLLGADAVQPFVTAARERGGGLFLLVRTSNPGARDIQDQRLAAGGSVSERLAEMVRELGAPGVDSSGLSDVGAVVAATAPERLAALRERMPHAVFLLPGVGIQGGEVEKLGAVFAAGPASGLITSSRSIVSAHERSGGDPATAAARAAATLREEAWKVAA